MSFYREFLSRSVVEDYSEISLPIPSLNDNEQVWSVESYRFKFNYYSNIENCRDRFSLKPIEAWDSVEFESSIKVYLHIWRYFIFEYFFPVLSTPTCFNICLNILESIPVQIFLMIIQSNELCRYHQRQCWSWKIYLQPHCVYELIKTFFMNIICSDYKKISFTKAFLRLGEASLDLFFRNILKSLISRNRVADKVINVALTFDERFNNSDRL